MTTRTYFCLAFWRSGLHATITMLMLKWTFCLCVFNVSCETAGQRLGQLFHRTAATIVCMFAYTCVHGHRPPDANYVAENVYSVWILGVWTETALATI